MIKQITSVLFSCSLLATTPLYAEEVYKRIDESGVPSFSDTKSDDAEKIIVEPLNVQKIPALKELPPLTAKEPEAIEHYASLVISSPENDTTFRNEHKITITAKLKPGLKRGHKIEFLDNGQPLQAASTKTSIVLTDFERGTHSLSVRIIDKNGDELQTSSPTTIHVFRSVIQPPPPANN